MTRKISFLVALGVIFLNINTLAADPAKEAAALQAAEKWLALVDDGQYAVSWNESATLFRNAVEARQWEQSIQSVRKPLGRLISRKVLVKIYQTELPGAPDGEYVVIRFAASFANKKSAVETVTPMMDIDGTWRVSGYFIQ